MEKLNVEEELIRRYEYLLMNKELILAMCINYGIEKDRYKRTVKRLKELIKSMEDKRLTCEEESLRRLAIAAINDCREKLDVPQVYLFSKVSDEIVNAFEEFLFTDGNIEDTILYKHIEALKSNPDYLTSVNILIDKLEDRRLGSIYLIQVPTFTVWKILSYVRRKNKDNKAILDALDKYYNIERYMISGVDYNSGYVVGEDETLENGYDLSVFPTTSIYSEVNFGKEWNAIAADYPGNEFEEEDNYRVYSDDGEPTINDAKTEFIKALQEMPMLPLELKSNIRMKKGR